MKQITEYETVKVKIKDIKLDGDNPNTFTKEMESRLEGSMDEFGNTQDVVVDKNTMILADGEHRIKEYLKRGLTEIPVKLIPFESDAKRRAYRQAANKIKGTHDTELDMEEYKKIIEGGEKELLNMVAGISMSEVENHLRRNDLMNREESFDLEKELGEIKEPVTKPGDIWKLGDHILLCGDSTIQENTIKLFSGIKPILMVTDPPYGVNYDLKWRDEVDKKGVLGNRYPTRALGNFQNDNIIDWSKAYALFPGDVMYVYHAGKYTSEVAESIKKVDFELISQIIWVKPHFALSRGDYHWKHEPVWYAVRKGKNHNWQGSRKECTVWEIAGMNVMGASHDVADKSTGHGTQKPVECMIIPINNNTKEGECVYDPFGGSGTTLIACEKTGRICRMIELDPIYCDIIKLRWESFSGKKAEKIDIITNED